MKLVKSIPVFNNKLFGFRGSMFPSPFGVFRFFLITMICSAVSPQTVIAGTTNLYTEPNQTVEVTAGCHYYQISDSPNTIMCQPVMLSMGCAKLRVKKKLPKRHSQGTADFNPQNTAAGVEFLISNSKKNARDRKGRMHYLHPGQQLDFDFDKRVFITACQLYREEWENGEEKGSSYDPRDWNSAGHTQLWRRDGEMCQWAIDVIEVRTKGGGCGCKNGDCGRAPPAKRTWSKKPGDRMKSLDKIYAPYLKNPFAPGAALFHKRSKVYFFRGNEYLRYDDRKKKHEVKWGYPKRVGGKKWPGVPWTDIDAAFSWKGNVVYLFKGSEYVRFNMKKNKVTKGPKKIATNWKGWPASWAGGVDAAFNWGGGRIYFFKGNQYIRYDRDKGKVDKGPKNISGNWGGWPASWADGVDSAINFENGRIYFFKGNKYLRYDKSSNKVDKGPKVINYRNWRGLGWRSGQ